MNFSLQFLCPSVNPLSLIVALVSLWLLSLLDNWDCDRNSDIVPKFFYFWLFIGQNAFEGYRFSFGCSTVIEVRHGYVWGVATYCDVYFFVVSEGLTLRLVQNYHILSNPKP